MLVFPVVKQGGTDFWAMVRKYVRGAYMFRYFDRRRMNARRNMPAVMAVGMSAATIAAKEIEPELRCPPEPGV